MNLEWITNLLPLLNATGIPLLAIGIIILIRAYHKAILTYKETSAYLTEENAKLRERLREIAIGYVEELEKMKLVASKTFDAIAELQARKVALLSKPEDLPKDTIIADVQKINEAIELLQKFSETKNELERYLQSHTGYLEDKFKEISVRIGQLAEQIGDTNSRITVIKVLTTQESYDRILAGIPDDKRGLTTTEDSSVKGADTGPLALNPPDVPRLP